MSVSKSIIIILYVLLVSIEVHSQQPATFDHAVLALQEKNYEQALTLLQEIENSNLHSPALYYNQAYAHYQLDHLGLCLLALEKCLLLQPRHNEALALRDIARNQLDTPVTVIPDLILWRWYDQAIKSISSTGWAVLQLVSMSILIFLLYLILFRDPQSKGVKISAILTLALAIWSLWSSYRMKNFIETPSTAIYMSTSGYLYEGADTRSETISVLSEGVKLYIIDKIGDWYKVGLEDKDVGWVHQDDIALIAL